MAGLGLTSLMSGTLAILHQALEEDLQKLKGQEEILHQEIKSLGKAQKKHTHFQRLSAHLNKEHFYGKPAPYKETKKTIYQALQRHHLWDGHLEGDPPQEEGLRTLQSFTLFVSAALDTDVFEMITTLSHNLKGLVNPTFLTLFREEDETLKGEIRFHLITHAPDESEGP